MGTDNNFIIPFKGLPNGLHNYRFQVSTDFFRKFESSLINEGNYNVDLLFDKRDRMMILDFSFEGTFRAGCDRCLVEIDVPTIGEDQIIVKVKDENDVVEKDNVLFIESDKQTLDVSELIYNAAVLHLPIINERDCEAEDYKFCDHAVLDKLENSEEEGDDDADASGGAWDSLKDLKLD